MNEQTLIKEDETKESQPMNEQYDGKNQSLTIELPWNRKIIFKNEYVEYKDTIINYEDITGIQYNAVNNSINLIPTSQERYFEIISDKNKISLTLSSTLYIKNGQRKDTWVRLIELSKRIIEPLLVKNKVKYIFDNNIIDIGGLHIDSNGYSKKKFWGGREYVMWNEQIFIPQFEKGNIYVYKNDDNNSVKIFQEISMQKMNAALLPELIAACKNYYDKM